MITRFVTDTISCLVLGQISIGSAPTRPLTLPDNGASIKILDSTKDLGLMIDNTFEPSIHCAQAFKKAHSDLILIKRFFVTQTQDIFIHLSSTLVRPHLEYVIQASSPPLKKDVDHLGRLQCLTTRMLKGCRGLSYVERLEKAESGFAYTSKTER